MNDEVCVSVWALWRYVRVCEVWKRETYDPPIALFQALYPAWQVISDLNGFVSGIQRMWTWTYHQIISDFIEKISLLTYNYIYIYRRTHVSMAWLYVLLVWGSAYTVLLLLRLKHVFWHLCVLRMHLLCVKTYSKLNKWTIYWIYDINDKYRDKNIYIIYMW